MHNEYEAIVSVLKVASSAVTITEFVRAFSGQFDCQIFIHAPAALNGNRGAPGGTMSRGAAFALCFTLATCVVAAQSSR